MSTIEQRVERLEAAVLFIRRVSSGIAQEAPWPGLPAEPAVSEPIASGPNERQYSVKYQPFGECWIAQYGSEMIFDGGTFAEAQEACRKHVDARSKFEQPVTQPSQPVRRLFLCKYDYSRGYWEYLGKGQDVWYVQPDGSRSVSGYPWRRIEEELPSGKWVEIPGEPITDAPEPTTPPASAWIEGPPPVADDGSLVVVKLWNDMLAICKRLRNGLMSSFGEHWISEDKILRWRPWSEEPRPSGWTLWGEVAERNGKERDRLAARVKELEGENKSLHSGLETITKRNAQVIESLTKAAEGKSDLDYQAEINEALSFIPTEFIGNDAWQNGIQRMAQRISDECERVEDLLREAAPTRKTEIKLASWQQYAAAMEELLAGNNPGRPYNIKGVLRDMRDHEYFEWRKAVLPLIEAALKLKPT